MPDSSTPSFSPISYPVVSIAFLTISNILRNCQIGRYPNIFSIGDIAAVKDENGKLYLPLAQIAVREAKYLKTYT